MQYVGMGWGLLQYVGMGVQYVGVGVGIGAIIDNRGGLSMVQYVGLSKGLVIPPEKNTCNSNLQASMFSH